MSRVFQNAAHVMVKRVVTWNTVIGDFLGSRESSVTRTNKVWFLKNSDSAWGFVAVSENVLNLSCHCFVLAMFSSFWRPSFVKSSRTKPAGIFLPISCSAFVVLGVSGLLIFPRDCLPSPADCSGAWHSSAPSLRFFFFFFFRLFFPCCSWVSKGVDLFFARISSGPFHILPSSIYHLPVLSSTSLWT